jgi:hypothetical protein
LNSHWQRTVGLHTETEVSVIDSARAVYVSNPKVGSSFLGEFMRMLEFTESKRRPEQVSVAMPTSGRGKGKGSLLTLDLAVPPHYRLFTFVREPVARTVSAFGEIARRAAYPLKNATCEERSRRFSSFVEDLERGTFVCDTMLDPSFPNEC